MFDNLELSTETFNGSHIERINFIFSPINRYDTTGVVNVWTVGGFCWAFDPQTADGKAILEYAGLTGKFALAHYKRQLAHFDMMVENGQIAEGDEFRRPTMPELEPEKLF